MSTYGARPRSADWITVSASPRIEPRVFLSFVDRFGVAEVDFVFFAIILGSRFRRFRFAESFVRVDDEHVVAKFLGSVISLLPLAVYLSIRNGGLAFRDINQPAIKILSRPVAEILDSGDRMCHLTKIAQENFTTLTFLMHSFPPIEVDRQFPSHGLKAEPQLLRD